MQKKNKNTKQKRGGIYPSHDRQKKEVIVFDRENLI